MLTAHQEYVEKEFPGLPYDSAEDGPEVEIIRNVLSPGIARRFQELVKRIKIEE